MTDHTYMVKQVCKCHFKLRDHVIWERSWTVDMNLLHESQSSHFVFAQDIFKAAELYWAIFQMDNYN